MILIQHNFTIMKNCIITKHDLRLILDRLFMGRFTGLVPKYDTLTEFNVFALLPIFFSVDGFKFLEFMKTVFVDIFKFELINKLIINKGKMKFEYAIDDSILIAIVINKKEAVIDDVSFIIRSLFEGFQIISQLGDGSFGKVYLCETNGGEQIAMKVQKLGSHNLERSFLNGFDNDHVVKIRHSKTYCFGETEDEKTSFGCIWMEHMNCGNLQDFLDNEESPSRVVLLDMLHQLYCGLRYIHEQRVVHCDIKPWNVLVNKNQDGKYRFCYADFGISIRLPSNTPFFRGNKEPYTTYFKDPLTLFIKANNNRIFDVSVLSDLWTFMLMMLNAFSNSSYLTHQKFKILRGGLYTRGDLNEGKRLIDESIKSVFQTEPKLCTFFMVNLNPLLWFKRNNRMIRYKDGTTEIHRRFEHCMTRLIRQSNPIITCLMSESESLHQTVFEDL